MVQISTPGVTPNRGMPPPVRRFLSNYFDHLLYRAIEFMTLVTSDKGGGKCVCPRLSVCLLAILLKNACIDLDEMLRVDRYLDMDELINF